MADHDINILLRARDLASKTIKGVNSELGKMDKLGKHLRTTGDNLKTIGVVGAGVAIAGLAASVKEASDLNEQVNKTKVVFKDASTEVLAFSKTTAQGLGLAQSEALEAAGAFGNMFHTVGLADDKSADMSQTMVTLAADMASFNNEDPSEMLDRLRSGLSGEAEPLRRFGVLLSEARVKQEAVNMGLTNGKRALTEQEKVQARYSLILKDTAVQQGDFARTSDSLANVQRRLKASLRDTGAVIGTALLPQVTKVALRINDLVAAKQPEIEALAAELPAVFDEAIKFAEDIPWDTIKDTFIFMGQGAKAALTMFNSLPSWLKTAVITGWGLNKLTGGLVTDLASGLIKGVLGMNAGVVNIKAGVVNGGGGLGGPMGGGKGGGRFGRLGGVGGLLMGGLATGLTLEAFGLQQQISAQSSEQGRTAHENLTNMLANNPTMEGMLSALRATNDGINSIQANPLNVFVQGSALDELKAMRGELGKAVTARQAPANAAANQASIAAREGENAGKRPVEKVEHKVQATTNAVRNAQSISSRENSAQRTELANTKNAVVTSRYATVSAVGRAEGAARAAGVASAAASMLSATMIIAAIWASGAANKPVIQSTTVQKTTTINNRYGETGGSRQSDWSPTH
jgi:hypothetical protein